MANMSPASRHRKRQQLLQMYGNYCCWCGKQMKKSERTIEHLIPKSRGGSNNISNLRLACFTCNNSRGNSLLPPGISQTFQLPR
jgi:5-methylcytosine-specific restriction endonuclease McrA